MFASLLVLALLGAVMAKNKRQIGRDGMVAGHEVLFAKFFGGDNACDGTPYDATEIDITSGTTCLSTVSGLGYYFQRVPNNQTHWRRCTTDNSQCMFNANETCTDWPRPLGSCDEVPYPLKAGVKIHVQYTIETFKVIRGDDDMVAVEKRFASDDCTGTATNTLEIDGAGEDACVKLPSGNSYRAFHNSYNADNVRICEYSPLATDLDLSCEDTAYLCHLYAHDKCSLHPEGGSFLVSTKAMPKTPMPVATKSAAATNAAAAVAVVVALLAAAL
eukprot:TRINITY_DN1889_c0_g1_i1.p1 TRINITY_DN1889_c0_g1~~TRINITY_DN1889_c0_g1_i1.p1  ORF type:complete len:311 (-),score=109.75 TRINITY_DN1889_c0_g1_i1:45-866(-)